MSDKTLTVCRSSLPVCNHPSNLCLVPAGQLPSPTFASSTSWSPLMYIFCEQETECCGFYCCLLYIGHRSPEYSCHTHLSVTTFVCFFLSAVSSFWLCCPFSSVDSSNFFFVLFFFFFNYLFLLFCSRSPLCVSVTLKADILHYRWGSRLCF